MWLQDDYETPTVRAAWYATGEGNRRLDLYQSEMQYPQ
jgi:hypothetical protein